MNLLVYAERDSSEVQRVVAFFEAFPVDSENTQLISGDHHLINVNTRDAFYVTKQFNNN